MRVVILPSELEASNFAANIIGKFISEKEKAVLGLATGSSTVLAYKALIKKYEQREISFKSVTTFNLDEYVGLSPDHPQSYRQYMNSKLFDHIDINYKNVFVPKCFDDDYDTSCENYESMIKIHGGIVENNSRFFKDNETQPTLAITMGIGTIMEAKQILLLGLGKHKSQAVTEIIEGPVSSFFPGSILQLHKNVIVIVDKHAASELKLYDYYIHTEKMHQAYTCK